jgi:hypothetical protein
VPLPLELPDAVEPPPLDEAEAERELEVPVRPSELL